MSLKFYLILLMTVVWLSGFSSDTLVYKPIYKDLMCFINQIESKDNENLLMNDVELNDWWHQLINYEKSNIITEKYKLINKQSSLSNALSFKAYYNENFETGIGDDEDITYKRRMFAGLELELFKSGLLTGGLKNKRNKQKEIIEDIKYERLTLESKVVLWHDYVNKYSNSVVKEKLLLKADIIKKLYNAYRLLSYEFKVPRVDVLKKKAELLEVTNKIKSLGDVEIKKSLKELPFIDVSLDSLLTYKTNSKDNMVLRSQIDLVKSERKMISQWSLRPNVRYNFLDREGTGNSKYGSAGFFLSIPFSSFSKRKKLMEVETRLLKEENKRKIEASNIEFLNLLKRNYQLKERLVSSINNCNITARKLESLKNRRIINPETFNAVVYLELLASRVSQEIQVVELNKDIYLNILSICKEVNGVNPINFTRQVSYNNVFKSFAGNRYLYVWSNFVKKVSANVLLAYLKEYEIGSVMISMGDINQEAFSNYINILTKAGVNVYALIGSNNILFKERKEITSTITSLCNLNIKGINLDIEPHTFDDWKAKKAFYYGKMLSVYKQVSQIVKTSGKQIHASIPVYYEQDFLMKLNPLVDGVFLMAYGTNKAGNILKRIKDEINIFGIGKTVVAYRPTDFNTAIEREILINKVIERTGCKKVAFHKGAEMFKLETTK